MQKMCKETSNSLSSLLNVEVVKPKLRHNKKTGDHLVLMARCAK